MPLLNQTIPHILNGVSERPEVQRDQTQLEDSKNLMALVSRGAMKRPGTKYITQLDSGEIDFDNSHIEAVERGDGTRWLVVIEGGAVRVFNASTGNQVTVRDETPDSQAYFPQQNPEGYRFVTIGDTTLILNRNVAVSKGTDKTPKKKLRDAYVTVEQVDFSTDYTINLQGITATYRTVDQVDARSRQKITTEFVAKNLAEQLREGNYGADRFFSISRFGSTIHISPSIPSKKYEITVEDGLGGNGLHLVKGEAQSVEDLPARAKDGAVVEITGDPVRESDDFYVTYDADIAGAQEHGVWKETVAPGVLKDIDPSTMPHALIRQGEILRDPVTVEEVEATPSIERTSETSEERGFTEVRIPSSEITSETIGDASYSEDVSSTNEAVDNVLDRHKGRLRKVVPGTIEGKEADVDVAFNLDTSLVKTGMQVRINVYKVDSGGNRTFLKQKVYGAGDTFQDEVIRVEKEDWAAGDEIELELEYQDGLDQPRDRRAELQAYGARKSVNLGYTDLEIPTILWDERRFVEVTYDFGTFPVGAEVTLELDSTATFTHTVVDGSQSDSDIASALATDINNHADYQATSSGATVSLSTDTADTYPVVSDLGTVLPSGTFYSSELDLAGVDLSGDTVKNLTDGSEASIDSNTEKTITASLSGGSDNSFNPGDRVQVEGTGSYFVLRQVPWDERAAGDDESNPFPNIVGKQVRDIFVFRNRLGFAAEEGVTLSANGDLFNLFRTSTVDIQADDRISVRSNHPTVSLFHSATPLEEIVILWSSQAQFSLHSGDDPMTPRTVVMEPITQYENSRSVKPEPIGDAIYFTNTGPDGSNLYRWVPTPRGESGARVTNLTEDVPSLMPEDIDVLAGNEASNYLMVSSLNDPAAIYVYTWRVQNQQLVQAGWNRWELPDGSIIGYGEFFDNIFELAVAHSSETQLYQMDLVAGTSPGADEDGRYLDHRVAEDETSETYDGGTDTTELGLPFAPENPSRVRVYNRDTDTVLVPTDVTDDKVTVDGDITGSSHWVGEMIDWEAVLTPFRIRDGNEAETQGHLRITQIEVWYHATSAFDVKVERQGRPSFTASTGDLGVSDGSFKVTILGDGPTTTITLQDDSPGGVRISSIDWEGKFSRRSERV